MSVKTITSLKHPLVKHLTKLRQQRSYREEKRCVLVEGKKLLHDICSFVKIKSLIVSDESLFPNSIDDEVRYLVTEEVMKKISGTISPEGVLAEVIMPHDPLLKIHHSMIVLDRLQDPGNVGTIIRTALAFGWDAIYCIKGTCDVWNDKVIRAGRGASFHIPIYHGTWEELLNLFDSTNIPLYTADLTGQSLEEVSLPKGPVALVLGNEGQGLSKEAVNHCQKITIPIDNRMESLNVSVAGGILMYELRRALYD